MNQDSEQNRSGEPESRRDGGPIRRTDRSFDRRDDGRNADAPRFNRSRDDKPAGPRERTDNNRRDRNDEPRRTPDRATSPSRFSRDASSQSGGSRNGDSRNGDSRSNERTNDERRPRFERDQTARPNVNRDNRSGDDKPRFDRDRRDKPSDYPRPRFDRDNRSGSSDSRRTSPDRRDDRFGRKDESPRVERTNDRSDRNTSRFGNERPQHPERSSNRTDSDRPRFDRDRPSPSTNREDRPRFQRSSPGSNGRFAGGENRRNRDEPTARPAWKDRDDRPANQDGRPDGDERSDRPARFSGDRKRTGGDTFRPGGPNKPAFKRVGGFNREADERNKSRSDSDDQRSGGRREDRGTYSRDDDRKQDNTTSRFSGQQRKDSGDRRTGFFTKAPNYNLEQPRNNDSFRRGRTSESRGERESGEEKPKRTPAHDGTTRLNRYIANSGVCSRREADELITRGDISVNGKVVTEMGYKVKEGDTVKYGTKVLNPERFVYVLLNKPKDYITTTEDPDERRTVMELVADAGNFRMYPVGRLDRNTTGLLLLTNDGELADKLTHPSYNIRKIYQVELDKPITEEHFEAIKKGIDLEDGPIKPDALSIVTPDAYVVGIEIHSGRNRIVRRLFEKFGYEVTKLDRTTYAGLTKKELPRGKWRFLDPKEVVKLKYLN